MASRVRVFAAMLSLVASCGSSSAPGLSDDEPATPVHAKPVGSSGTENTETATRTTQPQCAPVPSVKLGQGPCDHDNECVLSDLAVGCDACNFERTYPVLRLELAHRLIDCRHAPAATADVCGKPCPKHDDYTGAFYRAQCRDHRCIAYRYHSGG